MKHQIRPNIDDIYRALPLETRQLIERNRELAQGKKKSHPKIMAFAYQLSDAGYTYREIARTVHVSRALVNIWMVQRRTLAAAKEVPAAPPVQAEASITMIDKRGIFQRIFDWFR